MVGGTSNQSFPAQATLKVWIRKGEVRQVPTKGWARGVWCMKTNAFRTCGSHYGLNISRLGCRKVKTNTRNLWGIGQELTNQLMRKWPGLSETAVHVHHNVWWDLSGNPAKGPRTSLWRHFSVVMTPMQASSGWGISVCGHLNSSVTCGPVVPSQVVCSAVFLPYLNHFIPYTVVAHWHSTGYVCITAAMEINNRLKPRRSSSSATCGHLTQLFRPLTQFSRPRYLFGNQPMEVTCSPKPGPAFIL